MKRIPGCIVTIGVFDGVHTGHRAVLEEVTSVAGKSGKRAAVVTFEPHPDFALGKPGAVHRITPPGEKEFLFAELGIEFLLVVAFDKRIARMDAEEFIDRFVLNLFEMKMLVIGHDFCMGRKRGGTEEHLTELGKKRGFEVKVIPSYLFDGKPVSSTRVRDAIKSGEIELARNLLGRYPALIGKVVGGEKRGGGLGYPTANLDVRETVMPADAVYSVFAEIDGKNLPGVLAVGKRPTFKGRERTVEVHIPEFSQDLYGKLIKVHLVSMLRKERLFPGEAALRREIEKDIRRGLEILKSGAGT